MNEIKKFNYSAFDVRVIDGEEPLFCLADVCKILELRASRVKDRLGDGVTTAHPIVDALGRRQTANFVTEEGLYQAILESRKPEAKEFKHWVTGVVLPQIRKTGGYIPVKEEDSDMMIMAKALNIMQNTLAQRDETIQRQFKIIEYSTPKVNFAKSVEDCETLILVRDLAKILKQHGFDTGEIRLFERLRQDGYLTLSNLPTQRSMELGVMRVVEHIVQTPNGELTRLCTKITGKGQVYFVNKYCDSYKFQTQIQFNGEY